MNSAPQSSRSYDLLWLSLAILPLVTLSFLFAIHAQDYWWYVRIGQETLLQKAVPTVDTISYTYPGSRSFINPGFRRDLLVDLQNGRSAIDVFIAGLPAGRAFAVLWALARQAGRSAAGHTSDFFRGLSSTITGQMRPQIFAYPLFALLL